MPNAPRLSFWEMVSSGSSSASSVSPVSAGRLSVSASAGSAGAGWGLSSSPAIICAMDSCAVREMLAVRSRCSGVSLSGLSLNAHLSTAAGSDVSAAVSAVSAGAASGIWSASSASAVAVSGVLSVSSALAWAGSAVSAAGALVVSVCAGSGASGAGASGLSFAGASVSAAGFSAFFLAAGFLHVPRLALGFSSQSTGALFLSCSIRSPTLLCTWVLINGGRVRRAVR